MRYKLGYLIQVLAFRLLNVANRLLKVKFSWHTAKLLRSAYDEGYHDGRETVNPLRTCSLIYNGGLKYLYETPGEAWANSETQELPVHCIYDPDDQYIADQIEDWKERNHPGCNPPDPQANWSASAIAAAEVLRAKAATNAHPVSHSGEQQAIINKDES